MKTNENYKIAAERVKRANKKISDAQIETICESDCLENAERYVYKSQMLEEIEKEKEYIQGVFLKIKEKMLAFNLPIKYIGDNQDITNLTINSEMENNDIYKYVSRHKQLDLPEKYTDQQQKEVLKLFDSSNVSERKFKIISPSVNKEKIDNQITLIFEWIQDEEVWKTALNNYFDDVRKMELKEQKKEDVQFKLLMVIPLIIAIICVLFLGLYMLEMHPVITVFLGIIIVGGVLQIIFEKI